MKKYIVMTEDDIYQIEIAGIFSNLKKGDVVVVVEEQLFYHNKRINRVDFVKIPNINDIYYNTYNEQEFRDYKLKKINI